MPVNIEVFLSWGRQKRYEYLVEFARSILSANSEDYARQAWLNLYDSMTEMQSGRVKAQA